MLETKKAKPKTQSNGNGHKANQAHRPPQKEIRLTDNARTVLEKRYLRRGDDGKPVETIEEMFWRVAYNVALVEKEWGGDPVPAAEKFYDLLTDLEFFPNSPTFTGAGTPLGQLAACFVLKIEDDMGRSEAGIFQTLRDAALIQQTGGGNGFAFSRLRPKKSIVKSSAGEATGPVGFLRVYDKAFGEIAQGGTRRGANMAVLRVDHPDIEEFITCKTDENAITNFNISVGITDKFMEAVRRDDWWDLRFPDVHSPQYRGFSGAIDQAEKAGIPIKVYKRVRARELFNKIVTQAHHNGEPGVLFVDAANRENPVPHLYELEATNPCFAGSTRIATDIGLIPIRELAESGAALWVATDGRSPVGGVGPAGKPEFGVAFRHASPAWRTRENVPVMKLVTKHGYTVTATPDHKFLTEGRGYVELRHVKPGEKLLLQSGEGAWSRDDRLPNVELVQEALAVMGRGGDRATGALVTRQDFARQYAHVPAEWSHDLGVVLGWLVGDGWLSPDSKSPLGMIFGTQKDEACEIVYELMRDWFGEGHVHDRASTRQITYGRLPYEFFRALGVLPVRAHEKRVPDSIWRAPCEAVVGFLQGLFTADGTVNISSHKKSCSIRLASSSRPLLEDVQLLLLNLGIVSRIHLRRPSGYRSMPNGKGGYKEYFTYANYELLIDKANRDRFVEEIGFLSREKQLKAEGFISAKTRISNAEAFVTRVASIELAGVADVYDLTEPQTHSVVANGIVAHQCGEQWLGPYENCCLGSINLAQHFGPNGMVDWERLRQSTVTSTRFLDDVVNANAYVPAVPQLKEAGYNARRIGLGIMGLGDLMYHCGIRYGSEEAQEFAAQVMEFVRYHCMLTSIDLAKDRGAFRAFKGSIYDSKIFKWMPPTPLSPYTRNYGRPEVNWDDVVNGIKKHGIRNACQTTVAPTGTIATVAGCESYGCEPVFALAYIRHVNDRGRDLKLTYTSPLFEQALIQAGIDEAHRARIVEQAMAQGSCQDISEVPEHIRHTFVVSQDITADEHVRMQAAIQRFVDNSLSKCVTGDTLVLTAQGLTPIAEISEMRLADQFAPMLLDVHTPFGVERTDAFYYGGMRETRRVRLAYDYQIEGTPNHRVHVLGADGRVRFARLDELQIGDTVVLYSGQQVFGAANQPLTPYGGENRTNAKEVTIPERMTPELAYVLGCITSEGSITRNGITVTNGDRRLLERLAESVGRLFGLSAQIFRDMRRESVHTLQVNSRVLRNWLLVDLGLEAGAHNKIIPTCILRAGRHEIAAFLRGLFLDGYMTQNGRMFGIGLASRALIRQLQILLLNFGVVAPVQRSAEHVWVLTVSGRALERLVAFVEFDEVWKSERLAIRHEGRTHRLFNYVDLMPQALTDSLRRMQESSANSLRSLYGEQTPEYQRARVNLLQGHRLDREIATTLYGHFDDAPDPYAKAFFSEDRDGCLYVEVKSIESGFAEVFDLSVPGSHAFIANGLGNHNTCNFPQTATEDDVAKAYLLAWELGCKGLTVYVTGSRKKVVLETHATAKSKETSAPVEAPKPVPMFHETKKPRPTVLRGETFVITSPMGKSYVTINRNGGEEPFEVFINTGKAGSEIFAVSEAIGRLISYVLRMASPIPPRERLAEVARQLNGIGGGRPMGFGPNRVLSLPDAVGRALTDYLGRDAESLEPMPSNGNSNYMYTTEEYAQPAPGQIALNYGDLCPSCGEAAMVNEEGCRKCYACGHSEC